MAQRITRNASGVRQQARVQGRAGQVRKARAAGSGLVDRAMNALPFTEEQWHRFFTVLIVAAGLTVLVVVLRLTGLWALGQQQVARATANAGYRVENVSVRGTDRLDPARVYERALDRQDLSMMLVDVEALRQELLRISWVKDARVSRQLPDMLVIDIVERQPHAVLRRPDRLVLIDETGRELDPIPASQVGDMLVIEGEGAQSKVADLAHLLEAAPALRPQVRAARWVGNRRWDLTFTTGQTLALPEGAERSAAALISFARADGMHRLIGGEAVAFDLRNAPRMYLRAPGHGEDEQTEIPSAGDT
ncbi:cell division protein FtsQ/DivIB [Alteraurantiacibacter buctensis]|uniref:Cell division protein FtsQ n=1 Tax=Alteraurantiacibacter buctensis TaxID=1503981 RepID=A0A844Z004_9SPHN|nr:FtsQ-type POTRA domain-containing protein [Alteraurantiacibacter buctensis]MXO72802.1 FtsQ-type POTRA domain-containing protein [Alteraurantiacibacter buctensis]